MVGDACISGDFQDFFACFEPIHLWHLNVHEDKLKPSIFAVASLTFKLLFELFNGHQSIAGLFRLDSKNRTEENRERLQVELIVVNQQYLTFTITVYFSTLLSIIVATALAFIRFVKLRHSSRSGNWRVVGYRYPLLRPVNGGLRQVVQQQAHAWIIQDRCVQPIFLFLHYLEIVTLHTPCPGLTILGELAALNRVWCLASELSSKIKLLLLLFLSQFLQNRSRQLRHPLLWIMNTQLCM